MALTPDQVARQLDHASPASNHAQAGSTHRDTIAAFNAFLAKVDAANITGLGTNNVATFGLAALGSRTPL